MARNIRPGTDKSWSVIAFSALTAALFSSLAVSLHAQQISYADDPPANREQLFTDLASDVDALSRELNIYKRVAKLVSPSVVHVESTPLPQYRFRRDVEEAGSGVLVRFRGKDYVLTNRHVIKHSQEDLIWLELADGRQVQPTRIWSDKETDVAVLAVEAKNLLPARIGNSDQAEIGEIVMAFGSPFNLRRSVTRGIISAKGRSNLDLGDGEVLYQKFLQTDAAINPGNSGGPLVNLRGEVVGLNTAIASSSGGNEGIGFSIPVNVAVRIMRELIENGQVERGFLGVTLDGSFDSASARFVGLHQLQGARVKGITSGSPAAESSLLVNDIILKFDGMDVQDDQHLINLVKRTEIGRKIEVVVYRDRQMKTDFVKIGRLEDFREKIENR
ncbi:MAG: trypsin-like peptidase domain-containing protein [Pirellulales bacterium]|nr:trypsin-like peptidase domain-containing protein [Pirellulales bacterium]